MARSKEKGENDRWICREWYENQAVFKLMKNIWWWWWDMTVPLSCHMMSDCLSKH